MDDGDWKAYGETVAISGQAISDSQRFDDLLHKSLARTFEEWHLDSTVGPRYGPRRVLNDAEQADLERRQELAATLEAVADEWGIDLHEDCGDW